MQRLVIGYDEDLKRHDTGPDFPERPQRLDAVRAALEWSGALSTSLRVDSDPIGLDVIERIHDPALAARIERACRNGERFVDEPDVAVSADSYEIALRAAGIVVRATRHLAAGDATRGFCGIRPPGHHAERNRAMGFCLFNNVALAAATLKAEFGLERIAIVDWDVHHGNGTQHSFEEDPGVLFVSLHEDPRRQYPGTGFAHETGRGPGEGFTINVPLAQGAGDAEVRAAFTQQITPRLERFEPQFVLVSAGFDAHADDPLGHLGLTATAYTWMLGELLRVADRTASGRLLSVLEGGYNLHVLRTCIHDHVEMLHA